MNGYEKLMAAVKKDCNAHGHCGCFNPDGCNVEHHRIGTYGEPDFKMCSHAYCDKFKWVIDQAKHYGEALSLPWEDILDSWEADRNYWYMNYYQECNQPTIKCERVRVFETVDDLHKALGDSPVFRCPCCGGVSTSPYRCNSGLTRSDGTVCNWAVYGLFRGLGKDVYVYCKDKLRSEHMFMPIAWEKQEEESAK